MIVAGIEIEEPVSCTVLDLTVLTYPSFCILNVSKIQYNVFFIDIFGVWCYNYNKYGEVRPFI